MPSMSLNTLECAKKLEAAGFTRKQAEAQADMLFDVIEEKIATKHDLRELEYRLTIRFGGMLAVSVAALAALITFIK